MSEVLGFDCYFLCQSLKRHNCAVAFKAGMCYITQLIQAYKDIRRGGEFIAGFMESTLQHKRCDTLCWM